MKSNTTTGLLFASLQLDNKTPQDYGNLEVQFSTWKRATIRRNENIFHSISNTHQMAKIITVAQWTAAACWQRTVSCILLYVLVWEKNCIWSHLACSPDCETHHFIWYKCFFFPLSLSRIWLASCFNPNHFSGLLFCHETRAVNEIHTLTGYTAEHRGNCRLWCHQLILTIWIKKKKKCKCNSI